MDDGKVYRVCRRCGERWNVSALEKGEKIYLCPYCRAKERRGE